MRRTLFFAIALLAAPLRGWAEDVFVRLGPPSEAADAVAVVLMERGFVDASALLGEPLAVVGERAVIEPGAQIEQIREDFYDGDFDDAAEAALELLARWERDRVAIAHDPNAAASLLETALLGVLAMQTEDEPEDAAAMLERVALLAPTAVPDPERTSETVGALFAEAQRRVAVRPLAIVGLVDDCRVFVDGFVSSAPHLAASGRDAIVVVDCAERGLYAGQVAADDELTVRWLATSTDSRAQLATSIAHHLDADRAWVLEADGDSVRVWGTDLGDVTTLASVDARAWVEAWFAPAPAAEPVVSAPVTSRHKSALAWTFAALSVASMAGGGLLEWQVVEARDGVDRCADDDACVLSGQIVDERRQLRAMRNGATAAWIASGALLGSAIVAHFTHDDRPRLAIAPLVAPRTVGIVVGAHLGTR